MSEGRYDVPPVHCAGCGSEDHRTANCPENPERKKLAEIVEQYRGLIEDEKDKLLREQDARIAELERKVKAAPDLALISDKPLPAEPAAPGAAPAAPWSAPKAAEPAHQAGFPSFAGGTKPAWAAK